MNGFKVEEAILLLCDAFRECPSKKKPTLYHSVRVGSFLFQNGYDFDIQIAGFLHDVLEDTNLQASTIEKLFGSNVLGIVRANSVDRMLPKDEIIKDVIQRCCDFGESALIVKVADVYDNFLYYHNKSDESELTRCRQIMEFVLEIKPDTWTDPIFGSIASKILDEDRHALNDGLLLLDN